MSVITLDYILGGIIHFANQIKQSCVFKNLNFIWPFELRYSLDLMKQRANFSMAIFIMLDILLLNGSTVFCCMLCSNSVDLIDNVRNHKLFYKVMKCKSSVEMICYHVSCT